jgi:hypothetical protein
MRVGRRTGMTKLIVVFLTFEDDAPNKYALWENVFCTVVCWTIHALIITKHTQITNKCIITFTMYFIHNILIDMFRLVFRPKHVSGNIYTFLDMFFMLQHSALTVTIALWRGQLYLFLICFSVLLIWYILVQDKHHDKCKAVTVRAMKAYRGRKGIAPFILDFDTRWVWVQIAWSH